MAAEPPKKHRASGFVCDWCKGNIVPIHEEQPLVVRVPNPAPGQRRYRHYHANCCDAAREARYRQADEEARKQIARLTADWR